MNKTMKKFIMVLMAVMVLGSTVVVPTQTAQAKIVKTKGYYMSVAAKSMKNMQMGYPILKKVKFEKNKFTAYGGFMYYTSYDTRKGEKTLKEMKRTFTLSKKCEYLYGGYTASEGQDISKNAFVKKLKNKVKKNKANGDLIIRVKGKKIVQMYLSNY